MKIKRGDGFEYDEEDGEREVWGPLLTSVQHILHHKNSSNPSSSTHRPLNLSLSFCLFSRAN